MTRYRTRDGDMLDRLCWKYYGRSQGAVEAVLEANPGLALRGPVLPTGIEIVLPDLPTPTKAATIRLWD